jgi:glycosyltransferase involved in cell wall biosynthesis
MKILIVQDTDWVRRNPYQHTHLAERLSIRGHEIKVVDYEILWREEGTKELFSKRKVFRISRIHEGANIEVIRPIILKIPVLDYVSMLFTYSKEIHRQIREFKPDIVLGNDILTTFLAFRLAKKYDIKTIFYSIDIDYKLIPFRFLQFIGKLIESKNIKTADLVISINKGLRDYTIRMGAKPEKTLVIRSGIESQRFDPKIDGKDIRKKYGIKKNDIVLFFMGWLYDFSGLKEIVTELPNTNKERIKLLIVGDGDAFEDLKKMQKEYNLENKMILTGRQPYELIPKFLSTADVCLLPAHNNAIMKDIVPIKTYEYMAMENPIISTKLPGVMKEFGDNNGVIYVDKPEDVLKKAIELVEIGGVKKEGRKARKFVEKLDWNNVTNEFERVMMEMI